MRYCRLFGLKRRGMGGGGAGAHRAWVVIEIESGVIELALRALLVIDSRLLACGGGENCVKTDRPAQRPTFRGTCRRIWAGLRPFLREF